MGIQSAMSGVAIGPSELKQVVLNILAWRGLLPRLRERWLQPYHGDWTAKHHARTAVSHLEHHLRALSELGVSLEGKAVLEIGTGPHLGVAIGLLGAGASEVTTIDIAPLNRLDSRTRGVYRALGEALPHTLPCRKQAQLAFDRLASGSSTAIAGLRYRCPCDVLQSGLASSSVDVIVSYAVLEHVRSVNGALSEMRRLLRPGGSMAHWIDLADHLWLAEPLRFLRYTEGLFCAMTSNRSTFCNRQRLPDYIESAAAAGLRPAGVRVTRLASNAELARELPRLAPAFRRHDHEALRAIAFTFMCVGSDE